MTARVRTGVEKEWNRWCNDGTDGLIYVWKEKKVVHRKGEAVNVDA